MFSTVSESLNYEKGRYVVFVKQSWQVQHTVCGKYQVNARIQGAVES